MGKGLVNTLYTMKERSGIALFRLGIWLLKMLGGGDTKRCRCFLCMEEYGQKGRGGEKRC
jgi:hypothetical protein